MMTWFMVGMIIVSILFGILNGRMDAVSNAVIAECGNAVQLMISLIGTMAFWSGIMRVAEKAKLTEKLSKLLSPITKVLFKGLGKTSRAMQLICMNISANLLGLGNVATPLGIQAMSELHKEDKCGKDTASHHMIMLVVLNTASVQILPTTIATLRLKYGAQNPLDILPAILIASLVSVAVGVVAVKLCDGMTKQGR